ncbi:MAG: hypothetical protein D6797_08515 [Bdellovibrio sp.]|nr:MAG: hypothetical protein D6797_08515 [Bdellovibrio sp.]
MLNVSRKNLLLSPNGAKHWALYISPNESTSSLPEENLLLNSLLCNQFNILILSPFLKKHKKIISDKNKNLVPLKTSHFSPQAEEVYSCYLWLKSYIGYYGEPISIMSLGKGSRVAIETLYNYPMDIAAFVSVNGDFQKATSFLPQVKVPSLLIVKSPKSHILDLNIHAQIKLKDSKLIFSPHGDDFFKNSFLSLALKAKKWCEKAALWKEAEKAS